MGLVKGSTTDEPIDIKGTPDAPPKRPRGRPKGSGSATPTKTQAQENKQIEDMLSKMLSAPGVIFALNGDEYCAKHYEQTAPELAKQITIASLRYPQLRKYFLVAPGVSQNLALFTAVLAYLYAPMAHHISGVPRLPQLEMLGVPVPPEKIERREKLTEEMVLQALIRESEAGEILTDEALLLIEQEGFGHLLEGRGERMRDSEGADSAD